MFENYFKVGEAAKKLGVHSETVRRLCRDGDLSGVKFGNMWLIHQDDLEKFSKQYPGRKGVPWRK